MSRKNTPPSYTEPGGPSIVDTHSYKLSPLGPALQLGGGSNVISANSFCILLAEVPRAFDIFGFGLVSLFSGLLSANEEPRPLPVPLEPAPDDMILVCMMRPSTPCLQSSSREELSLAGIGGEGRRGPRKGTRERDENDDLAAVRVGEESRGLCDDSRLRRFSSRFGISGREKERERPR